MDSLEMARRAAPCPMCEATARFTSGTRRKVDGMCTLCKGLGVQLHREGLAAIIQSAREEGRREQQQALDAANAIIAEQADELSRLDRKIQEHRLTWTREQPTEPGLYRIRGPWLHEPNNAARVRLWDGVLTAIATTSRWDGPVADAPPGTEWAGPIPEAEEASDD